MRLTAKKKRKLLSVCQAKSADWEISSVFVGEHHIHALVNQYHRQLIIRAAYEMDDIDREVRDIEPMFRYDVEHFSKMHYNDLTYDMYAARFAHNERHWKLWKQERDARAVQAKVGHVPPQPQFQIE